MSRVLMVRDAVSSDHQPLGRMAAKAVVRDVARVARYAYSLGDQAFLVDSFLKSV